MSTKTQSETHDAPDDLVINAGEDLAIGAGEELCHGPAGWVIKSPTGEVRPAVPTKQERKQ